MNRILKRTLLPGLMAASLTSVTLIPAQPAAADTLLRDAGAGAATSAASGAIRGCGSLLNNAVKGAAAGAAVNAANSSRRNRRNPSLVRNVAVGGTAGAVAGAITRGCRDPLGNAVDGAAAGAVIHLLNNRR
ncbi:hypothetical protein IQ243_27720 [Nostocales cyanobacterium LEGE 11386]|nr:hypothetical protein [Nostocales cyanobacterium LEGE 11386]